MKKASFAIAASWITHTGSNHEDSNKFTHDCQSLLSMASLRENQSSWLIPSALLSINSSVRVAMKRAEPVHSIGKLCLSPDVIGKPDLYTKGLGKGKKRSETMAIREKLQWLRYSVFRINYTSNIWWLDGSLIELQDIIITEKLVGPKQ